MATVADKMGLGPQRSSVCGTDGIWTVTVTPPPWSGFSASQVRLTAEQHDRYLAWLAASGLIQDLLPELSKGQREILISGINDAEFGAAFGDDE